MGVRAGRRGTVGQRADLLGLFGLKSTGKTQRSARDVLDSSFRTYYFSRDGLVSDISGLDPGAENIAEGGWGGLTEFSSRVGDVVSEIAGRGARNP